ncbi:MAG: inositol monophosphatase [Clostridia bacterium]|nr:inositol monophosphatase [Clostridia bacterium]
MIKELEFLIDVVKNASLLINEDFEVKAKGEDGDLVTNFDFEVEKYIIERIKEKYPDFKIVSEEYNSHNELSDNCFTIDPIDGTINFAHNIPLWGIQVACIKNSKTCASVIYLPRLNELYYADENGAFLNNKKIQINNCSLTKGVYTIEGPNRLPGQAKMKQINKQCRDFYCTCLNFVWVASGRLSGTIFTQDSYWDYVPGQFIVEKAGGVIYNSNGSHIAANSKEFLELLKENASYNENEKVEVIHK